MRRPDHSLRAVCRALLLPGLLLFFATSLRADEVPSFFIEKIEVTGGSRGADGIVAAESHLREGRIYDEAELRDAIARIHRLEFVLSADFRLARGSSAGKYVLIIAIRQMTLLFLQADTTTHWEVDDRLDFTTFPAKKISSYIDQTRTDQLVAGARTFLGSRGMLDVAVERISHGSDRYTASFSEYDLFGTRASITAVASYRFQPGLPRDGDPEESFRWGFRNNLTYEVIAVAPIRSNESLRLSLQRSDLPVSYFERSPVTDNVRHVLRPMRETRKELFWIHDTTNDPLFPTSGLRVTLGGARTSMPTYSFTRVGRVHIEELQASLEQSWPVTVSQAVTLGGSGSDFDQQIRSYRAFGRYSVDLLGRERTLRMGDLRLELSVDRVFKHIRPPNEELDYSTLRAGLAYRSVWGVLRLDLEYLAWRRP